MPLAVAPATWNPLQLACSLQEMHPNRAWLLASSCYGGLEVVVGGAAGKPTVRWVCDKAPPSCTGSPPCCLLCCLPEPGAAALRTSEPEVCTHLASRETARPPPPLGLLPAIHGRGGDASAAMPIADLQHAPPPLTMQ